MCERQEKVTGGEVGVSQRYAAVGVERGKEFAAVL